MRVAGHVALVVGLAGLAGCHALFGLDRVDTAELPGNRDAAFADADQYGCFPATGAEMTVIIGPRTNGTGMAFDTFVSNSASHFVHNYGALDLLFACLDCDCGGDPGCESVSTPEDDAISLLRFDIGSAVPMCAKVEAASMYVHTDSDNIGSGSEVAVYEVLEEWDEGSGSDVNGVNGAANFGQRQPTIAWNSGGTGPTHAPTAAATFSPRDTDAEYKVALDTGLVEKWIRDPMTNRGLALAVTGSDSDVHFYSTEATTAAVRPALSIMFRAP